MALSFRSLVVPCAALLLGGCVAAASEAPVVHPAPPTYNLAGLQGVMGQTALGLEALFGPADLDVREGSARKLQFGGPACVLDAYLYPPSRSAEAVVTYVDARLPDGRDIDRASCVASLTRRQQAR